jgi:hypothetical protein
VRRRTVSAALASAAALWLAGCGDDTTAPRGRARGADILLTRDFRLNKLTLAPGTVDDITEFLKALTDPAARDLNRFVPDSVPSGLPVDRLP